MARWRLWIGLYDWNDAAGILTRHKGADASGRLTANNGDDTLEFGLGIDLADVQLRRVGLDLQLAIASSASDASAFASIVDQITLKEWYASGGATIEHFVFVETGTFNTAGWTIGSALSSDGDDVTAGGSGKDWLTGGLGDDEISGGAETDILSGNEGGDALSGGAGDDILYGGGADDILDGGAGADQLFGGSGVDIASYASNAGTGAGVRVSLADAFLGSLDAVGDQFSDIEGLEGTSRADRLLGDNGENILRGRGGDDVLRGDAGDDTYDIGKTDGLDTIDDGAFEVERILDANGVLNTSLFSSQWTDLGTVNVSGVNWRAYRLVVTRIVGGQEIYRSRDGVDFLYSSAQSAAPAGGAWPFANAQWKQGAYRTGVSVETIVEKNLAGAGGDDTLELGAGVSLSDLSAVWGQAGQDLRINIASGGSITMKYQNNADRRIESLLLSDGLVGDLTRLKLVGDAATAEEDFYLGGSAADVFDGAAGDDVISGGGGADQLSGGGGDDVIEGGAGADTLDGGADSVTEDHAALANQTGSYGDTLRYVTSGAGVSVNLSTNTTSGGDAAGDVLSGFENVIGSSFADALTGDDRANRLSGLAGDDVISGGAGDDVISGGASADTLYGGAGADALAGDDGADTLHGEAGADLISGGDGNDIIYAGAEDDSVDAGAGDDIIYGGAGNDQIGGGAGADQLFGDDGDDVLGGEAGDDLLEGGAGNDQLLGGLGADLLKGGVGDDAYVFDANSGADVILDADGTNSIAISGVSADQVWLSRSGDDLKIGVIGGDTRITLSNYYAASAATRMKTVSVQSASGDVKTLYLAKAEILIGLMGAQGITPPASMPSLIGQSLSLYWHANGKAVPTLANQILTTIEDVVLTGSVGAEDHDDNIASYMLASAASHGAVALNALTGQWSYTPGADFAGSDAFTIRVTDADGQSVVQNVSVGVAPVNDAPRSLTPSGALQIGELASDGAEVAVFAATDVDAVAASLSYELVNNAGGLFRMDGDGTLAINRAGTPGVDYEASASHVVRVRVTDADGASFEQDFTVAILEQNEAPTDITAAPLSLNENAGAGAVIGSFQGFDPDGDIDPLSFSLVDDAGGRFAVSAAGQLSAVSGLDFESGASYSILVRATDRAGLIVEKSFSVGVIDVNEAPTALDFANAVTSLAENTATSTRIKLADLIVSDDGLGSESFALTGADAANFEIDGGALYLKAGVLLDYESKSAFNISVTLDDVSLGAGPELAQSFTLNLMDLNEAPSGLSFVNATTSVAENTSTAVSIKIADIIYSDDALGSENLGLTGADASSFEIIGSALYLKAGVSLNFEAQNAFHVSVTLDDPSVGGAPDIIQGFTLSVTDVNEAPTGVSFAGAIVNLAESASTAARIKIADLIIADDALGANALAIDAAFGEAAAFEIVGSSLYLKAGVAMNYEAHSAYSVRVNVDDSAVGASPDAQSIFTLAIADVNEAPTGLSFTQTTLNLAEDTSTAVRIKIADLVIMDDALGVERVRHRLIIRRCGGVRNYRRVALSQSRRQFQL